MSAETHSCPPRLRLRLQLLATVCIVTSCGSPPSSATGEDTDATDGATPATTRDVGSGLDTEGPDASGTSGGETDEGDVDACAAGCQVFVTCDPEPGYGYEDCVEDCEEELEIATMARDCRPALEALYACMGTLSCEELEAYVDGERHPCNEQESTFDEACGSIFAECQLWNIGARDGSECEVAYTCGEGGYAVACNAERECECFVDDEFVGTCAGLETFLCEAPAQSWLDLMNECCFWDLDWPG